MTHLSPYSYLFRGICSSIVWLFGLYKLSKSIDVLKWEKIKKFDTKTMCAILLLISSLTIVLYDIIATTFKYREGFVCDLHGDASIKSASLYSLNNQQLVTVANAFFEVACVTKSSAMFLLLATFNLVFHHHFTNSFMTSREFRVYTLYSFFAVPLYPILQIVYLGDSMMTTVAPQVVYHCECLLLSILMTITGYRMRKLLNETALSAFLRYRIEDYIQWIYLIAVAFLLELCGLGAINIDLIAHRPTYVLTPFLIDLFTAFFSIGWAVTMFLSWSLLLPENVDYLFEPKPTGDQSPDLRRSPQYLNPNRSVQTFRPIPIHRPASILSVDDKATIDQLVGYGPLGVETPKMSDIAIPISPMTNESPKNLRQSIKYVNPIDDTEST